MMPAVATDPARAPVGGMFNKLKPIFFGFGHLQKYTDDFRLTYGFEPIPIVWVFRELQRFCRITIFFW